MPLCRLSIHADYDDASRTVDVALPSAISVHALIPTLVDLAGLPDPPHGEPTRWDLGWLSGAPIDLALTLAENDVRDGDVLLLTRHNLAPLGHRDWDPCRAVASAASDTRFGASTTEIIGNWALLAGGITLVWTGDSADRMVHVAISAVAACAAMALAMSTPNRSTLRIAAVTMCAATGFLAVPPGAAAASAFLAAVAALSSAAVLARWTDPWSPSLVAAGALSFTVALSSGLSMVVPSPPATVGVTVTTASLAVLAVSPRLATALAGLGPRGDPVAVTDRAARGHAVLSGLVAGSCLGAAAGSALVLIAHLVDGADPLRRAAFTAVVGLALVTRARVHADSSRRLALTSGGLLCATVALAISVDQSAVLAASCAAAIIGVGLAAAARLGGGRLELPTIERGLDVVDYVALTTIIPLACWVGGVYTTARGWHSA
jgi:type VII secretion integral membrane protein EccD